MIIVSLHCQMGNQMFQYAFAKAIAHKKHICFLTYLGNKNHPFKLNYFRLNIPTQIVYKYSWITTLHQLWCRFLKRYFFPTIIDDNWKIGIKLQNNAYYVGYFQSPFYFKDIIPIIKKEFAIKKEYVSEFNLKYQDILSHNKIIVIHIRRTDYLEVAINESEETDISLPLHYYHKVMSLIQDIEHYKIYFIGDDMDSIKSSFGYKNNYYFETNSPIIDFQLIQHADISIIANSTFAWWAAFLRINNKSTVFAPNYWLGHKEKKTFPAGIKCDDFQWIDP